MDFSSILNQNSRGGRAGAAGAVVGAGSQWTRTSKQRHLGSEQMARAAAGNGPVNLPGADRPQLQCGCAAPAGGGSRSTLVGGSAREGMGAH